MRLLVVLAHPSSSSFSAALFRQVLAAAAEGGHEARGLDLAGERFDPSMGEDEWRGYDDGPPDDPVLAEHAAHLRWAEGIVFVHPTWWGGPPALLKGWIDRTWRPDVAFEAVPGRGLAPKLTQIRLLAVVTTMTAPRVVWAYLGQPGRRTLLRGLKPCVNRRAKTLWLALHGIDDSTALGRDAFLDRVRKAIAGLPR